MGRTAWSKAAEQLRCFKSSCMQSDGKAVTWIWSSSLARCPSSTRHEVVWTDLDLCIERKRFRMATNAKSVRLGSRSHF